MDAMLNIGVSKDSILEAKKAILEIMIVDADLASSDVKIQALKTLHELCSVNGTSITDCTFSSVLKEKPYTTNKRGK